ncbi:MAG: MoxR family ATPase [Cyanobacteria bacterium J06649_12]
MDKVLGGSPYTGKRQPSYQAPGLKNFGRQELRPYLPSTELVNAVNLAIFLQRPLLLRGEPGSGKTLLASSVSYELNLRLISWYVKSTSNARDGLYTYDTLGRLRDAQLANSNRLSDEQIEKINYPKTYIKLGPLGEAFSSDNRCVVLIDEIDKADVDFPNDLLRELDEMSFSVEEVPGYTISTKIPPIIIITSNGDRELPDAFLRRCLFHYVDFPKSERLIKIVSLLFPEASEKSVKAASERFMTLRNEMIQNQGGIGKVVGTSELIDWFTVLQQYPDDEVISELIKGELPFHQVLLKSWDDHKRYLIQKAP